jgi:hypothetical protein
MSEHGILFKGFLVRRILAGEKWQTRRLPGPTNSYVYSGRVSAATWAKFGFDFSRARVDKGPSPAGNPGPYLHVPVLGDGVLRVYPLYSPGDVLWIRETWCLAGPKTWAGLPHVVCGKKLGDKWEPRDTAYFKASFDRSPPTLWRPSIHMPRWASRLTLTIKSIRVEMAQDISDDDIRAEGFLGTRSQFAAGWDRINGKRDGGRWAENPWVWVIEWERVKQ